MVQFLCACSFLSLPVPFVESHRLAGDAETELIHLWLGGENSALCVTTLDPKSTTV